MRHEEVVQKVRDILNEHGGSDGLSIATDRVLLDTYIGTAIADAVVLLANNGYEVNVAEPRDFTFEDADIDFMGFVSLIEARAGGWKRSVTKVTQVGSPEYIMSRNEFTRPGVNNPIVFIWRGMLQHEPYEENASSYIRYNKKYDEAEGLKANTREATAVCYMAAALVLGIFGDDAGKQRLSDICMNMLK